MTTWTIQYEGGPRDGDTWAVVCDGIMPAVRWEGVPGPTRSRSRFEYRLVQSDGPLRVAVYRATGHSQRQSDVVGWST
jgi:hypothetical protein